MVVAVRLVEVLAMLTLLGAMAGVATIVVTCERLLRGTILLLQPALHILDSVLLEHPASWYCTPHAVAAAGLLVACLVLTWFLQLIIALLWPLCLALLTLVLFMPETARWLFHEALPPYLEALKDWVNEFRNSFVRDEIIGRRWSADFVRNVRVRKPCRRWKSSPHVFQSSLHHDGQQCAALTCRENLTGNCHSRHAGCHGIVPVLPHVPYHSFNTIGPRCDRNYINAHSRIPHVYYSRRANTRRDGSGVRR